MKRTEPKSVGEIIRESISQSGLSGAYAEQQACYLWPEVVGAGINRYTFKRYVDHGVMHVYLTSSALKNELSYHRRRIVEQINHAVGSEAITDIIFH